MAINTSPRFKLLCAIVAGVALVFAIKFASKTEAWKSMFPTKEQKAYNGYEPKGKLYKIGTNTWGGYAGGFYFNEGFKPNPQSRYKTKYGFDVEFVKIDDWAAATEAFKKGEIDLMFGTIDSYPTVLGEGSSLLEYKPKVIFSPDKSRGGDNVVVRRGINTTADLRGAKIAFTEMTPSHTLLLWLLESANLSLSDVTIVKAGDPIAAANMFKSGQVDAACVWAPDDQDCIAAVSGSKVLASTKQATEIIYDCYYVKQEFLDANLEDMKKIYEGWMIGNSEINTNPDAKKKAATIMAAGFGVDEQFCWISIGSARLCTAGDNKNIFNESYAGINGNKLYTKMAEKYQKYGYVKGAAPWRDVNNDVLVNSCTLAGDKNAAENTPGFTAPTKDMETKAEFSNKTVTITFATGSAELDDNDKYIIDNQFLDIARTFGGTRIRIEGNTDNTGSADLNRALSKRRAQAVVEYLVREYSFNRNRFIVVGNGPDKPVAGNDNEDGREKNRRTDFKLIEN